MNFIDKKVSVKRAISILAKNGVQVDGDEATVILDFLYLLAKNYNKPETEKKSNPNEKSNSRKNAIEMP